MSASLNRVPSLQSLNQQTSRTPELTRQGEPSSNILTLHMTKLRFRDTGVQLPEVTQQVSAVSKTGPKSPDPKASLSTKPLVIPIIVQGRSVNWLIEK